MNVLALVPARGGSSRIPRKNTRLFGGKPLLAWTVEAAVAARRVTRVVVSSDDYVIGNLGMDYGAEWIERPAGLATDTAPIHDVELHALGVLAESGYEPDVIVRLQPTSPLRTASDIDGCLWYLEQGDPACVSVHHATDHPWLVRPLDAGGYVQPPPVGFLAPSQKYPPAYRINGAVYAARLDYFNAHRGYFGPKTQTYVMPTERGIDIDTELDWTIAEAVHVTL